MFGIRGKIVALNELDPVGLRAKPQKLLKSNDSKASKFSELWALMHAVQ